LTFGSFERERREKKKKKKSILRKEIDKYNIFHDSFTIISINVSLDLSKLL
jgi:hypothetical protein